MSWCCSFFLFVNDPAATEAYTSVHTLSLHDALPIEKLPRAVAASACQLISVYAPEDIDAFLASRRGRAVPVGAMLSVEGLHVLEGKLANLRSEEHTSELQSLMRISYAVFCLKKKNISYTAFY